MNNLEQYFKKAAEQIRMTSDEKSAMRFRLQQEMAPSAPSSVSSAKPSPYVWMFAPRSLAMLGVALLVVLSTGSAYASEGSLPGTPLYPVKTKIVEPLKVALAPTVQAKAQANADIAATRVQEAQTLAAKGTLTPEAVKQISDNYNAHAKAALALAAHIDGRSGEDAGHDAEAPDSEPQTAVSITVAVNTRSGEDADTARNTAGEVVIEPEDSAPGGEVVSIMATAPVALSVSVQATSSEDSDDSVTSSSANTRNQNKTTFAAYPASKKTASTTRSAVAPVAPTTAPRATSTATSTKQNNSRDFVRTLRASLSAQAQILEKLDAQVRLEKGTREDN